MIISGKHVQTTETNIYNRLKSAFENNKHIEVTPLQEDLFDSNVGQKKLLGRLIADYPDGSLSFFIALIKEGEAATVINEKKEIDEITAPDGAQFFNRSAVINISNDTVYYATIDRFNEYDIRYFIKRVVDINSSFDFVNIADEQALKKIARYGVNGIDLSLMYNQAYIEHMKTKTENQLLAAARDFGSYLCGYNKKLCDANLSNGLRTFISINRTGIPKKDKKALQDVNYSEEALKDLAEKLCSSGDSGNDASFTIRLKNGGGKVTDKSLYLAREVSVSREKNKYNEMIIQINSHILKFKEQNKEYLLSMKE